MRISKLILVLMTVMSLSLFSCNSDNDPDIQPPPESGLVPEQYSELNYSRTFYHDNQGRLSRIKVTSVYSDNNIEETNQFYTYGTDGRLLESNTSSGWRMVYTYENGRIARTDEYINSSNSSQHHTYEYNSKGLLARSITWQDIPEEGGIIPVSKEEFDYNGEDNVTEQRLYYYTTSGEESRLLTVFTYSDYDDRVYAEGYFAVHPFNPSIKLSENNPGKLVIKNNLGNISSTSIYTYEYHVKGYPVKRKTQTELYNGERGEYESIYKFKE